MSGGGWAAGTGCRIERLGAVRSTNTVALERARAGEPGGLWIVADEQTAGRGRHGRQWHSPRGNLHATRLVVAAPPLARLTGLAFVAAVALHEAVSGVLGEDARASLVLKWPNDLIAGGGKLAGILVEAEERGGDLAAAVGIGVNVARTAQEGAASLAGLGADLTADEMFDRLGPTFEGWLGRWDGGAGFAAVRAAWLAGAAPFGTPVRVRAGRETIAGRFAGLDDDGALLVGLADGRVRRIAAGEVMMAGEPG